MTDFDKNVLTYSDALGEPYKSLVTSYTLSSSDHSAHRRAEAALKVKLVQDQIEAFTKLTNALEADSVASDRNSRTMNRLTLVLAIIGAVQAALAFFR